MTNRQIESSREARLWLSQIVLPIVGVVMVVDRIKQAKKNIEDKFMKK